VIIAGDSCRPAAESPSITLRHSLHSHMIQSWFSRSRIPNQRWLLLLPRKTFRQTCPSMTIIHGIHIHRLAFVFNLGIGYGITQCSERRFSWRRKRTAPWFSCVPSVVDPNVHNFFLKWNHLSALHIPWVLIPVEYPIRPLLGKS
jgi:hypothetical protein